MLKTMYEQFIITENATVLTYGLNVKKANCNLRYYTYVNKDNNKIMTVFFESELPIYPHLLSNYISTGKIILSMIEFKEM
jgi:hypothetical protein